MQKIGHIANGVNIDHIPCGHGRYVVKILNLLDSNIQVWIGLNLPSNKLGLKDLVKVENRILNQQEITAVSLFCIGASLSVIKNFEIVETFTLTLPGKVNNIIVCPNSRCVTKMHTSKFRAFMSIKKQISLKCCYCEQIFLLDYNTISLVTTRFEKNTEV